MSEQIHPNSEIKDLKPENHRFPRAGEITTLAIAALITAGIVEYADKQEWTDAMYEQMEETIGCSRETSKTIMHIEEVVTLTVAGAIGLIMMRRTDAASAAKKHAKEAATP